MRIPERCWLGLVAAVGLVVLGWALFGPHGLREVRRLRAERRELASDIARGRSHREELEREVLNLRENPRAIEARARKDLGMIRKGETVFLLHKPHDSER